LLIESRCAWPATSGIAPQLTRELIRTVTTSCREQSLFMIVRATKTVTLVALVELVVK